MNTMERQMLELLKRGSEYGYMGIKAEFEAEGTRDDEMFRLIEITRKAGLNLGIKIGGGEAITDLYRTKQIGVEYIIAPMVETPYAVSKYIEAKNKVYNEDERKDVKFLFNLETLATFNNLDGVIKAAKVENGADGIVFGRVDFTHSQGLNRSDIENLKITNYCFEVAKECKKANLELVVGGAITQNSLSNIKTIYSEHLNRFETRKIIFDANSLPSKDIEKGILLAVKFEYLWLQNKFEYYNKIANEDLERLKMLKNRLDRDQYLKMKNALIVGSSGMIGQSIFEIFANNGYRVTGTSRDGQNGFIKYDIKSQPPQTLFLIKYDAICFAQGMNFSDNIFNFQEDKHLEMYQANCLFIMSTIWHLIQNDCLNRNAKITITSSIWQEIGKRDKLSYCVTKSAIKGLVNSLSIDLGEKGILVNAVLPGALDSVMTRQNLTENQINNISNLTSTKKLSTVKDIADAILFLSSDQNTNITNQFITIDGGFTNAKFF